MSTEDFILDSFLSDTSVGKSLSTVCINGITRNADELYPLAPGEIDPRLLDVSYSGQLNLHSCPRRYELDRKRSSFGTANDEKSEITFAYGHLIGDGIADIFLEKSWEQIVFRAYLAWGASGVDLFAEDTKADKSFWSGLLALEKFQFMRASGFLSDYEVLHYGPEQVQAVELGFRVQFPDGFALRGYVDVVLKHKTTGEVVVIECKHTGAATINPATFKNSAQGISYSVILDVVAPDISSYAVYYLVYGTKSQEFYVLPFTKTYVQRARWIREVLLDIESIKMYAAEGLFPMRGESCFSFWRECKYLNTCELNTDYLTKPPTWGSLDDKTYTINLTLVDLIDAQLKKTAPESIV